MRGDSGSALRWAAPVGMLAAFVLLGVAVVAIMSRALPHDAAAVAVRLPAEFAATTTTVATVPPTKATTPPVATSTPPTSELAGAPLAAVFITGPGATPAGEVATYCLTGAPSPVVTAAATLDGAVIGPVDDGGCLTFMVDAGAHDLRVVAFGGDGSSVTSHMSITGMA